MIKFFLYSIISISFLYSAEERSMFDAGNLNTDKPYGLSDAEKVIFKNKTRLETNKKILETNEKTLNSTKKNLEITKSNLEITKKTLEKNQKKTKVIFDDIDERIDGLTTLVEGDSLKLNTVSISLKKQKDYSLNNTKLINANSEKIDIINKDSLSLLKKDINNLKSSIETNKNNIEILKKSIDKLAKSLNGINATLVTRVEFNKKFDSLTKMLDKELNSIKKSLVKKRVKVSKPKVQSTKKITKQVKSKKELLIEAKDLFKKDYFTKALPIFQSLVKKNYKPAESNYYIGEIKFYRKKYKDALHYYKTSMLLYDKAKYLPRLLLHSAVSFEKTGDIENANNFYSTLVEVYPNTSEAKEASKKIK